MLSRSTQLFKRETVWLLPLLLCLLAAPVLAERNRPSDEQILKRFPAADRNGDGKLDAGELAKLRELVQQRRQPGAKPAKAVSAAGVPATLVGVKYGDHERNVLDLWQAKSDKPTPLVLFIHGGGFVGGDRSAAYGSKEIDEFLAAGISYATLSYRFRNTDPRGVRASLTDCKRALQFLRSRAKEWNFDPDRVGAYGGSAGAGTSLWLATHDDMADPNSDDPVLRQSTRLQVAGANNTQATYDLLRWPEFLKVELDEKMTAECVEFFGLKSASDLQSQEGKALRADLDMLALLTKDDPPLFIRNSMDGEFPPKNRGHLLHHPAHAKALSDRAAAVGVEALVYAPGMGLNPPADKQETLPQFFIRHLTAAKQ